MWYFRALAFDLDGTLASVDRVPGEVLTELDAVREERALILVTGRRNDELDEAFPGLAAHFDAVVTENGSVLRTAVGDRLIDRPVDPDLDKALADRGVQVQRGRVLLALDGSDAATAVEVIAGLGLDHQVVHNRGSAMVLPAGATKGRGLLYALDQLGLSPHNTIAVGDAENDFSLLQAAEVGVAVANAVPSLADRADLVLDHPDGAGVLELVRGPLLAGHTRLCPDRHWVTVGQFDDGEPARLPGSQYSVLVSGETGAGKSYLAGLLAEQWIEAGYSVVVVDPEGDHTGLAERPGVHLVDASVHLPSASDVMAVIRPSRASLVLDLSGLDPETKIRYQERMPEVISAERARHGFPHWVIYEEAHQPDWNDTHPAAATVAEPGTCVVTWRPEALPPELRRNISLTLTLTGRPLGPRGRLRATLQEAGSPARAFELDQRRSTHVRHRHKYAAMPLPPSRRFYFHGEEGAGAASLEEFSLRLRHCDLAALEYHLARSDFSRWVLDTLADQELGRELADIEHDASANRAAALERARHRSLEAIQRRYLAG